MFFRRKDGVAPLRIGNRVRIRAGNRSPYSGRFGTIVSVNEADERSECKPGKAQPSRDRKRTYVVQFDEGLRFRFGASEFDWTEPRESSGVRAGSATLLLAFIAMLVACSGPVAKSQPEAAAPGANDSAVSVKEAGDENHPSEKPRMPASPTRKLLSKDVPRTSAMNKVSNAAVEPPLPVPPTVVSPPVEITEAVPEPLDVAVEQPAPRRVTIPAGTLIGIRMIDSVDSESGHVGQSFLASVDAPVIVDGVIVFSEGAEVYVKLIKVQSAGNVRGTSELQLQLDRIVNGEKSYIVESGTFAKSGSAQGLKTARTAGLGAAIGAAIGAIASGGKGAVIGGAAGAGAGVGIEAATKGEQVRVDSETRLDFRLEKSLEVVLQTPSNNSAQPNNSGPLRIGTRP